MFATLAIFFFFFFFYNSTFLAGLLFGSKSCSSLFFILLQHKINSQTASGLDSYLDFLLVALRCTLIPRMATDEVGFQIVLLGDTGLNIFLRPCPKKWLGGSAPVAVAGGGRGDGDGDGCSVAGDNGSCADADVGVLGEG